MTRIVLTISDSHGDTDITNMVRAGVSCFRLNSAHLSGQRLLQTSESIRRICVRLGRDPQVFVDLPGTKARLWASRTRLSVQPGDELTIQLRDLPVEDENSLTLTGRELFDAIELDTVLKITRRGNVRLKVTGRLGDCLGTVALSPGLIGWGYHVVIEDRYVPATRLAEADERTLPCVLSAGPDFVCASFADTPAVVDSVSAAAARVGVAAKILAKVESPAGLANLHALLDACDGAIIGRDDLSAWCSEPEIQKETHRIIRECKRRQLIAVPASNYFSSLCSEGAFSADNRRDLASVLKLEPDFIYCNETNRCDCWQRVVIVAEEFGLL